MVRRCPRFASVLWMLIWDRQTRGFIARSEIHQMSLARLLFVTGVTSDCKSACYVATMIRKWLVLSLLTVSCWAQNSSPPKEPTSLIRDEYLHAYNLHDADAVLALYADDAVLLSEAGVFRGKSEIRKWLQFAFDQGSVLETISATREKASGTIAYGTGHTKRLAGQEVHLGHYPDRHGEA
jgi:ketosteroid isomerase-like protein